MKHLYIVLSRSQTLFARLIRLYTRKFYNHVSIALDPSLETLYSFGRRNPEKMFPAGFIEEGVHRGFFGIHPATAICVLKLAVEDEDFRLVKERIERFRKNRLNHHYAVSRVLPMAMGIETQDDRDFTCSMFVAKTLEGIYDFGKDYSLVYPEDFYKLNHKIIYEGTAGNYNYEEQSI